VNGVEEKRACEFLAYRSRYGTSIPEPPELSNLWVKDGMYEGKKVPAMTAYVDNSYIEKAHKQLGLK
jgi:hypothetical protein